MHQAGRTKLARVARVALGAALASALLVACGYGFTGRKAMRAGVGAHKVYVPVFKNETLETGLERDVTRAFTGRLAQSASFTIVTDETEAEFRIEGVIKGYGEGITGFGVRIVRPAKDPDYTLPQAGQRRMTLVTQLRVVKLKDDSVVLGPELFSAESYYGQAPDLTIHESESRDAAVKVSEELARQLSARLHR